MHAGALHHSDPASSLAPWRFPGAESGLAFYIKPDFSVGAPNATGACSVVHAPTLRRHLCSEASRISRPYLLPVHPAASSSSLPPLSIKNWRPSRMTRAQPPENAPASPKTAGMTTAPFASM